MNPNFEAIGQEFVRFYYQTHDKVEERQNLANLYADDALMTFENEKKQGKVPIMQKVMSVPGGSVHALTRVDCHPLENGAILIVVLGQLKTEGEANPLGFNQTFVIKPANNSYFIQNEIFQLAVHNF